MINKLKIDLLQKYVTEIIYINRNMWKMINRIDNCVL